MDNPFQKAGPGVTGNAPGSGVATGAQGVACYWYSYTWVSPTVLPQDNKAREYMDMAITLPPKETWVKGGNGVNDQQWWQGLKISLPWY